MVTGDLRFNIPIFLKLEGIIFKLQRRWTGNSHQERRHSKKLQMQGVRALSNEAYLAVRRNDERRSACLPCGARQATPQMDFLRSRQIGSGRNTIG
ncbi:MAG: hypothetical protein DRG76_03565 [Deltaproteobacteria bacterium]|nr:MAG: hypothetical protein DRG76_03565 [Deltaproteobacteria bacterium]